MQQFPCSGRSEMMRQLPRRPANDASIARPRGSLKEARDVLAILLLMTGPVSSKYLMMGDIWGGAGCHSDGNSEQHIRPGPVSNPVCHCHTATVVELIRGATGNIAGGLDWGNIAGGGTDRSNCRLSMSVHYPQLLTAQRLPRCPIISCPSPYSQPPSSPHLELFGQITLSVFSIKSRHHLSIK